MLPTPTERFWPKVEKTDGCWNWKGGKNDSGYGLFWNGSRLVRARRYSYELAKDKIPDGLVLDHLCRNPSCVNPDHLEPVTDRTNVVVRGVTSATAIHSRKTHCIHGHLLSGDNLYMRPNGSGRDCLACRHGWWKRNYDSKKFQYYGVTKSKKRAD